MKLFPPKDYLERKYSEIRGLGGGFCLHPTQLQFRQRLGQSMKLQVLKDESFDLLSLKNDFPILHSSEDIDICVSELAATADLNQNEIGQVSHSYLHALVNHILICTIFLGFGGQLCMQLIIEMQFSM